MPVAMGRTPFGISSSLSFVMSFSTARWVAVQIKALKCFLESFRASASRDRTIATVCGETLHALIIDETVAPWANI